MKIASDIVDRKFIEARKESGTRGVARNFSEVRTIIIITFNNNNISKAPFSNGPKALFTRSKIQIHNKTFKKLKEVKD